MMIGRIETIRLRLPTPRGLFSERIYEHLMRAWELAGGLGRSQAEREWSMSDEDCRDTFPVTLSLRRPARVSRQDDSAPS